MDDELPPLGGGDGGDSEVRLFGDNGTSRSVSKIKSPDPSTVPDESGLGLRRP